MYSETTASCNALDEEITNEKFADPEPLNLLPNVKPRTSSILEARKHIFISSKFFSTQIKVNSETNKPYITFSNMTEIIVKSITLIHNIELFLYIRWCHKSYTTEIGIFFYKDITQRDFNDIDFAIEEKNISKSAEVMKSLGYEELKEESDFSVPNRSRSYHIDYSWVKYGDNGRVICNSEIHWQPTNSALFIPDQFKELKKATKPTRVLTEEIQLFSKIDNAYFMILHHGLVDNWFQLRHLVDLVVALKELSSDEVSELKEKLSKANVLMAFYYGVQLSRDLLNVELDVVETPKLHFYKQYLKAFKSGEYVGKWSENKFKLFYYLLMNDNHAARGRSLIKFLKYLLKEKKFKYLTSIKGK